MWPGKKGREKGRERGKIGGGTPKILVDFREEEKTGKRGLGKASSIIPWFRQRRKSVGSGDAKSRVSVQRARSKDGGRRRKKKINVKMVGGGRSRGIKGEPSWKSAGRNAPLRGREKVLQKYEKEKRKGGRNEMVQREKRVPSEEEECAL